MHPGNGLGLGPRIEGEEGRERGLTKGTCTFGADPTRALLGTGSAPKEHVPERPTHYAKKAVLSGDGVAAGPPLLLP